MEKEANTEKIGQNQFYDIITGKQSNWKTIIYELIQSEQLNPWDINLVTLTNRYFEKITELEEADFYISSKVLLAAALLLRIKSDFLLNKYIKSIDEILFGKKQEGKYIMEKIEINEDELPLLIPKTPLPRQRKVTLNELITALNTAINTESRRIKREVSIKRAKKLAEVDFPSFRRIDLKDRIRQFYAKILTALRKKETKPEKNLNKIGYSKLAGKEREERLACFLPLLHLSNAKKLWIEQESHLNEIWIYLYEYFNKNKENFLEELEQDIEEMKEELKQGEAIEEVSGLEKARLRKQEKKKLQEEVRKELEEETGIINKQEKIEKLTGFKEELE